MKNIYAIAVLLLLWYTASFLAGTNLVPPPHTVAPVFLRLLFSGELPHHGAASLLRLFAALASALLAGLPLGIAAGIHKRTDRLLTPVVYVLYPLPKIAFLPVFMLLFGLGNSSRILLLFSMIVLQIILAARDGVREIPEELNLAVRTLNLKASDRFFRIYLPASLSRMFSALRISVGIGFAILFFAENYAARWGLGYFIMNCWIMIDYPRMFAGIVFLGLVSWALLQLVDLLHRLLCPWNFIGGAEIA